MSEIKSKTAERVAENLKIKRLEKGKTVNQMAKEIGISQSYLANIENHKRVPSISTIDILIEYFQIDPYEMFL